MSAHLTALAEDFEEVERGQKKCGTHMTQQSHKGLRVIAKKTLCSSIHLQVEESEWKILYKQTAKPAKCTDSNRWK